ncbi:preprotein translocase subunit SecA [Paenibacillus chungangensis]|uniref:Protein translocase subunit SecA n=1 Tax=Paenibacillus chungangensis TaxID=696535 RepID=A0ABW3HRE2_9BACL
MGLLPASLARRLWNRSHSNGHLNLIRQYGDSLKHVRDEELGRFVRQLGANAAPALNDEDRMCRLFAAVTEAVNRVHGFELHDAQLIGGLRMAQGHMVEMATGEGKTVTVALSASWYALQDRGVHVMTTNAYLAERDYEHMKAIYEMLGFSAGLNESGSDTESKKYAYRQAITYGVFNEFGFDYLRDHLVYESGKRVQRALAYAIVDEADSIMIDEGKTPLIIADRDKIPSEWYGICAELIRGFVINDDYDADFRTKQASLTDSGIERAERALGVGSLYDLANAQVLHILDQSLHAHVMMERDRDYIIDDQQMKIIDSFTGRVLEGRLFNEGLHQAIEAKERLPLSLENNVLGEISVQQYLSLYERLTGMTGTIKTDEEEIERRFGLSVSVIPTARPVRRLDERDYFCRTKEEKVEVILREVKACHQVGQPVLIGTTTIAQSEELARNLRQAHIPFRLLNAKNEREEAGIIAEAGQYGAVTIATNMAGRGTDIRLGPGVDELGGLYVIGTERHESRRIDNQLRGRAGRQGDPGRSKFIVSLEDELIVRYGEQDGIHRKRPEHLFKHAQKCAESSGQELRSYLAGMDAVTGEQRRSFYAHRNELWQRGSLRTVLNRHVEAYIQSGRQLSVHSEAIDPERWPFYWQQVLQSPRLRGFIRVWHKRYLKMLDRYWISHMECLRELMWSVHYQSYAQEDPIRVFRQAAYDQFAEMQRHLTDEVAEWMLGQAVPRLLKGKGGRADGACTAAGSKCSHG